MDLSYQMMDQVLKSADFAQAASANRGAEQNRTRKGDDFATMVRQKQQQTQGKTELRRGGEEPVQTADTEASDEQYAMAAGILLQIQPVVEYIEPRTDLAPAPITLLRPETIVEAEAPATAETLPVFEEAQTPAEAPVAFAQAVETAPVETESRVETERAEVRVGSDSDNEVPEEYVPETPVFGTVDAAPVKVAEPVRQPVELERDDAAEEMAARIEAVLTDENGNEHVELTLTPASLGKMTVDVTHLTDGTLHIALSVTTEKAMNLLQRHTGGLQELLSSQDRPAVQIEVRASEETQRQFLDPNDGNGQQQQQQQQQRQQHRREERRAYDFMQQLRLGLVELSGVSAG